MNSLLSIWHQARLSHGLYWPTSRPPVPWRSFFHATILASLVWLAYSLMTSEAMAQQLAELAESNAAWAQVAIDCLNGANGFYVKDAGIAIMCQRI
jgi:hypothetical protein